MIPAEVPIPVKSGEMSRRILLFALIALVSAALFDPADLIFHLKVPAFVAVLLVWLYRRGLGKATVSYSRWAVAIGAALVLPLIATAIGIANFDVHSGDAPLALLKSFLFLLITPVVVSEDIDLASLVSRLSVIVAVLTLGMVVIGLFAPPVFLVLYEFTMAKQNAILTESRHVLGLGIGQFYYKTAALMVFPLAYYAYRLIQPGARRLSALFMLLVFVVALLFSGARANILAGLFVIGVISLIAIRRRFGWPATILTCVLCGTFLATAILPMAFAVKESSNAIKVGHFHSYLDEFENHRTALLWGEGAETGFYSKGFEDWTTVTELSYLEIARIFGLPIMLLYCGGLLWIGIRLFKVGSLPLAIAYLSYLAISASNPLLISSTGLLVVCAGWKEAVAPSDAFSAFHYP